MRIILPAVVVNNLLVIIHSYFGLGYLLGADKATSTTLQVAFSWATPPTWGALILAGAVLSLAAPWLPRWGSVTVHVLASLPLLAFAVTLIAAEVLGINAGWGGPVLYLLPVGMHASLVAARHHPESGRA